MTENSTFEINAVVVTQGEINKGVTWTSSNESVTITNSNAVTGSDTDVTTITATVNVAQGATGTATITATSIGDNTKSDTCIVTIQSGGETFNPEMTPLTMDVSDSNYATSLLTVPQGANYVVNLVSFEVSTFEGEPIVKTVDSDTSGHFTVGANDHAYGFVSYATEWTIDNIGRTGLKIAPYEGFIDVMNEYSSGTSEATGTATVTITDLDNGTSAVKEITINFHYYEP